MTEGGELIPGELVELHGAAMTDQLTRFERVRLEALAQAVAASGQTGHSQGNTANIIYRAMEFHRFITEGTVR